jgi:hypothetical protein
MACLWKQGHGRVHTTGKNVYEHTRNSGIRSYKQRVGPAGAHLLWARIGSQATRIQCLQDGWDPSCALRVACHPCKTSRLSVLFTVNVRKTDSPATRQGACGRCPSGGCRASTAAGPPHLGCRALCRQPRHRRCACRCPHPAALHRCSAACSGI